MPKLLKPAVAFALLSLAVACQKKPSEPLPIGQPPDWLALIGGGSQANFETDRYILLGGYQSTDPKLISRVINLTRSGEDKTVWQLMDLYDLQASQPFQEVLIDKFNELPGVSRGHLPGDTRVLYFVTETLVHPPRPRQADGSCVPVPHGLRPTVLFEATRDLRTMLGKDAIFANLDDQNVRVGPVNADCEWVIRGWVDVVEATAPSGIPWGTSPKGVGFKRGTFDVRMTPWSTKRTLQWAASAG